jgi:hypothetical protein
MKKFTKEYAEKLAIEKYPIIEGFEYIDVNYSNSIRRKSFIEAYTKALEEMAAHDMFKALEWIIKTNSSISVNGYEKAISAINKVTK